MATNNLEVKFKVDASEVTRGSEDAKNKVKNAANEMASDVKNSSRQMEASMKDVSRATDGITDATKTASNAVKQMEGQVSSSASKMKSELDGVGSQLKSISFRQGVGIASRGLGFVGKGLEWASENVVEKGSPESDGMKVAGAGINGAASGMMIGAAAGPIGAAVGALAGGLIGAGTAALTFSKEMEEASRKVRENAEKSLQDRAEDLKERDRLTGYERENKVLMGGIGKTWWQNKSTGESISGEERIFKIQEARQAKLESLTKERDDYIRAHSGDTGQEAVNANAHLAYLDRQIEIAAQHLQALAPVVEAARRAEAEKAKAVADAAEKEKQKNSETFDSIFNSAKKKLISGLTDEKKDQEHTLADYQRQLQGVISRPTETPTDALTRIGGGRGYAAYNNSTANVQKQIEGHLKSVIKLLQDSITETSNRLDALINKNNEMVWANP